VQALAPRQLAVPWIAVAALAAVAWAVTVLLARNMGNGPGTMGLALLPFLGLWAVMMAAMMLPSVAPVAVLWTRLITGASVGPGRLLRMSTFLAGYLLAWAVAGTVAFAALAGAGRLLTASPAAAKWLGVAIFISAGVTDILDGYFARKWGELTTFGRMLDPIADKLLVASCLFMLAFDGTIRGVHVWAAIVILCREILVSGLREYLAELRVSVPVTKLAKWKTTLQLVAVGFLLAGDAGDAIVPVVTPIGLSLLWLSALLTLYTGWDYFRAGLRHLIEE